MSLIKLQPEGFNLEGMTFARNDWGGAAKRLRG